MRRFDMKMQHKADISEYLVRLVELQQQCLVIPNTSVRSARLFFGVVYKHIPRNMNSEVLSTFFLPGGSPPKNAMLVLKLRWWEGYDEQVMLANIGR